MGAGLGRYLARHHVGLLALFVAMSGTAYAASLPRNSVGTAQLKKGAVTKAKLKKNAVTSQTVKNGSLRNVDFATGQLPAGPQGAQGPKGDTGPPGPKGLTKFVIRGAGPGGEQVLCEPGEVAVGGGGYAEDGLLYQSQPVPFAINEAPVGWTVGAEDVDGSAGIATAWVVCAS